MCSRLQSIGHVHCRSDRGALSEETITRLIGRLGPLSSRPHVGSTAGSDCGELGGKDRSSSRQAAMGRRARSAYWRQKRW
jgi:hypothetical protein